MRRGVEHSGKRSPQLGDRLRGRFDRYRARFPSSPNLDLDFSRRERTAADRDACRAPEQLGIGELLTGADVAIVVEDLQAERLQLGVQAVSQVALLASLLAE